MTEPIKLSFTYQPSQLKLVRRVTRNGGTYYQMAAPQNLEVGGQRSGKTIGKLMFGIENYCLRFNKCDILILRRTFPELKTIMLDVTTFVPSELYDANWSEHIFTFKNGSRIVFASCPNNTERDIERYLGQAYPYILVDECAQFSDTVWNRLYARNLVNTACEPDEFGNLPIPAIVGCTNPIGAFWSYFYTLFVKHEPWEKEDGLRRARDGSWWSSMAGEPVCVHDPRNFSWNHSTVLDNAEYLKRDPNAIPRLRALPPALRKKFLEGVMDAVSGAYYDCWFPEYHVIDLREDPEAIIWQDWQPVIVGHDWGVQHHSAAYYFTRALVREPLGTGYKLKIVCFREIAPETTGQTNVQFADMLAYGARYPLLPMSSPQYERISGKPCKISTIFFSHEKFNRQMERHSPADEYSRLLRERGLPAVARASTDRVGSTMSLYNELKRGNIVILKTCPGIIEAIPALPRDPDHLEEVLKSSNKADDRFDAFRYGFYGMINSRAMPQVEKDRLEAEKITDPFQRHFFLLKKKSEEAKRSEISRGPQKPLWMTKL